MKKRILSLLLAVIMILQIMPYGILTTNSEDSADESVIGWIVEFNKDTFYLYKQAGSNSQGFEKTDFPEQMKILDVKSAYWGASIRYYYQLGTIDGSAHSVLDVYSWVTSTDVNLVSPPVQEPDDGLIRGEIGLVVDGDTVETLTIEEGEKTYVFTDLSDKIEGTPSYRWQMLVDPANDRWADILDYIYPYAIVSEALISNAGIEGGKATLRCIATSDQVSYVSGELDVSVVPRTPSESSLSAEPSVSTLSASLVEHISFDTMENTETPRLMMTADRSTDAFQIAVQYLYWNNSPLAKDFHGQVAEDTFTVTLYPGQAYNGTKNHPVKPGYKAYVRDENGTREYTAQEANGNVETHKYSEAQPIVFSDETEGREMTVYYLPEEVTFTVIHHLQHLSDDGYDDVKTIFMKGYSDYAVGDVTDSLYLTEDDFPDIVGYNGLYYDKETRISASGNTTIDIYYDRNYYLIDFDLTAPDGSVGYGVMPLYVRYGTQLQLNDPTAPGYKFETWNLTSVYESSETEGPDGSIVLNKTEIDDDDIIKLYSNPAAVLTIKHNLVYKAAWTVATTTYTVIYWLENADDDNFTLHSSKPVENAIPGSLVHASDHLLDFGETEEENEEDNFVFLDSMSDKNVTVKGDGTTAVNVYYARKYYSLTFVATGIECPLAESNHTHGENCDKKLFCTREEHAHINACGEKRLVCTVTVHAQHNEACCGIESHTHVPACYGESSVVSTKPTTSLNGAPDNAVDGQIYRRNWVNYIFISGSWYKYEQQANSGTIIQPSSEDCPGYSHSHDNGSCVCSTPLHTHHDACYQYSSCDKIEHTHADGCYGQCKLFEHNCQTDDNFTVTFPGNWNSTTVRNLNIIKAVTAKYDSNISDIWNVPGYEGSIWQSDATGSYYSILHKMPNMNIIMRPGDLGNEYTLIWYYALERVTPDTPYEGKEYVTNEGKYYYVAFEASISGDSDVSLTYKEDYFPITGFTQRDEDANWDGGDWDTTGKNREKYLYYTRNSYNLIFNDGVSDIKKESVLFEADISGKSFVPEIPSGKEDGSVNFVGWYTTQTCADGTEFDFAGQIMPARDLTLYAKWEPTYWNVKIYQDNPNETENLTPLKVINNIPFGTRLTSAQEPKRTPPHEGYIFAGWYYMDGSEEKRFDFNTMAIKHNYVIYAKWISEVPVPYTVRYITVEDDQEIEIAESTKGVALAEQSRSFMAKVDTDLYEGYRTGYFPEYREQTVKMQDGENVITFTYKTGITIPYRVTHVFTSESFKDIIDSDTLTLSWDEYAGEADSSQITVSFKTHITEEQVKDKLTGMDYDESEAEEIWEVIVNMSPDAYTQRITLIANSTVEQNTISFNWDGRYDMVPYEIHHYFQNLDDTYGSPQIQTYRAQYDKSSPQVINFDGLKMSVPGYQYEGYSTNNSSDPTDTTIIKPTAEQDGLIISLYYDRKVYDYTVKHYDKDTNTPIFDDDSQQGKYEQIIQIESVSKDIPGYQLVNGDESVELVYNDQEIICYYIKQTVKYKYEQIGVGGILDPYDEEVTFGSEPAGSLPILAPGYILEGWYCKDSSGEFIDLTGATYDNATGRVSPWTPTADDVGKTFTFFAKIIPTSLVIQNNFESGGTNTEDQGIIYEIKSTDENISLRVAVIDSLTISGLPIGSYEITVEDAWSWQYEESSRNVDFGGKNTVIFTLSDSEHENIISDQAHNQTTP